MADEKVYPVLYKTATPNVAAVCDRLLQQIENAVEELTLIVNPTDEELDQLRKDLFQLDKEALLEELMAGNQYICQALLEGWAGIRKPK